MMHGCSLGFERLRLETFFGTFRFRLGLEGSMPRPHLGLEDRTSRSPLGLEG